MSVRVATAGDLDALTTVLVDTSSQDPSYTYRYPLALRDKHPEDFVEHCRQKCAQFLQGQLVTVYEIPCISSNSNGGKKIVAFSCWTLTIPPSSDHGYLKWPIAEVAVLPKNTPPPSKRHANLSRSKAFKDQCTVQKRVMFDSRYPNGHLFLKVLYCHPNYQRRGAGRALTSWGIRLACLAQLPTTLFASSAGLPLYERLGFKVVDIFRVQIDGDDEYLDIPGMALEPGDPTPLIPGKESELDLWIGAMQVLLQLCTTIRGVNRGLHVFSQIYTRQDALTT